MTNIIRALDGTDKPELMATASRWFSAKWGIPAELYLKSMEDSLEEGADVPKWYVALSEGSIIGGLGVIENDFHDRKNLRPNVCAIYVEEGYRGKGLAGKLLEYACDDMARRGIDTLYLLTDHESFYEKYGWQFLCMARGDGEEEPSRMYVHHQVSR